MTNEMRAIAEALSIAGAMMLRALFTKDSPTMAAFFDALVGEMTGGKIRH